MAKQTINIGSAPGAGDGESIRSAFDKVNQNTDEIYEALENIPAPLASDLLDAMSNADSPSQTNPFATKDEIPRPVEIPQELTVDVLDALQSSNTPTNSNPFATIQDIPDEYELTREEMLQYLYDIRTLTSTSGIVNWNMQSSNSFRLTLTEDVTINNPTNIRPGTVYNLEIVQDLIGNHSVEWGSNFKFQGGIAAEVSSGQNAIDLITIFAHSSTSLLVVHHKDFTNVSSGTVPVISSEELVYFKNKSTGLSFFVNASNAETVVSLEYTNDPTFTTFTTDTYAPVNGNMNVLIGTIIPYFHIGEVYYRIRATNSVGETLTPVQSFTIYPGSGMDRTQTDYTSALAAAKALTTGTTYYIDPTAPVNGNGLTPETPYNSWQSPLNLGSGRTFLQKAGTTATFATAFTNINGICKLGTYGGTEKAKIVVTGQATYFMQSSYQFIIENFDIRGQYVDANGQFAGVGIRLRNSQNSWIVNCDIHGFSQPLLFAPINGVNGSSWAGVKVFNTNIYDAALDGVYGDDVTDIELGHCNIYNVNLLYNLNTNENTSAGDGVQFAFTDSGGDHLRFHIHHTTIDRSSTGNKFCLIWGAGPNARRSEALVEYNEFIINGNNETCIYTDTASQGNATIRYNQFKGVGSGQGIHNRYVNTMLVHNNVFDTIGMPVENIAGSANIYNNTFVDCNYAYSLYVQSGNISFNKNIVSTESTTQRLVYGSEFSKLIASDYNCYNMPTILTSYPTLADYKAYLSFDTNSIDADAKLGRDYTLASDSPCILVGQDDIGAYNFD